MRSKNSKMVGSQEEFSRPGTVDWWMVRPRHRWWMVKPRRQRSPRRQVGGTWASIARGEKRVGKSQISGCGGGWVWGGRHRGAKCREKRLRHHITEFVKRQGAREARAKFDAMVSILALSNWPPSSFQQHQGGQRQEVSSLSAFEYHVYAS